jgi:hypothetical protein
MSIIANARLLVQSRSPVLSRHGRLSAQRTLIGNAQQVDVGVMNPHATRFQFN